MKTKKNTALQCIFLCIVTFGIIKTNAQQNVKLNDTAENTMMVRIAEIEIVPGFLKEYNAILQQEAAASVEKEPGVIVIFPMYQRKNPHKVRILEIYANKAAYQSHLKTPHFQHYKTTTQKMVKSLKLVDMEALDKQTMSEIFRKL